MFGVFRTFLAIIVTLQHLLAVQIVGTYAVFSFFVLSGFLMTTIMHQSYGYSMSGLRYYAINRFLRLYPEYWFAIGISIVIIKICGENFLIDYHVVLRIPCTWTTITENAFILFPNAFIFSSYTSSYNFLPRLSPATWVLTIEIFYYILIGIGISRSKKTSLLWLFCSTLYVIIVFLLHAPSKYHYGIVTSGSFPFALGANLYFYKEEIYNQIKHNKWLNIFTLTLCYILLCMSSASVEYTSWHSMLDFCRYVASMITAMLIIRLYFNGIPKLPLYIDDLIGKYSYCIYLLHWQCGALVKYILLKNSIYSLFSSYIYTLILVTIIASVSIFFLDPVVDSLRIKMRNRSKISRKSTSKFASTA